MKNPYKKGEIIKVGDMGSILFDAYLKKLHEFHIKSRKGVRYEGCQKIYWFTALDNKTTFCVEEKGGTDVD